MKKLDQGAVPADKADLDFDKIGGKEAEAGSNSHPSFYGPVYSEHEYVSDHEDVFDWLN